MPTVIDSLLVKLGLDSSDFKKGTKEVDAGLKQITKSATAFLAVLGGSAAMKTFIEQQVEANSALDRFSKNLGEAVGTISAWSQAAEVAGGSAAGLQGTMDMLSKSQTELQLTGQSALLPYFARLGVAFADMRGQARPTSDMLLDLADRFGNMPRTTAYNMGRMMGVDQGTMQLLLKGRGEVELMLKRQKEYNAVTKQQAEEATRLRVAMTGSRQSFEAFGRELLSRATPAIEALFRWLEKVGNWARDNKEFVQAFLTILAVGLGAVAATLVPINLTAAAILGLAAAIAALWQDYQVFKRGGETLINWSKWEPGIKAAVSGIKSISHALMDAGYRMASFLIMTTEFYTGDKKKAKQAAQMMLNGMPASAPTPEAQGSGAPAAGTSPQSFFQSKGWSAAQAAGIVANLQAESGMNPSSIGDNGKAYGIAQWHPDRQAAFAAWACKDIRSSSLEEQLAFVHHELTAGNEQRAGGALRNAITAQRAGEVVSRMYERPGDVEGEAAKRGALARRLALGIPGASASASGAGARASAPMAGNTSSVQTSIGEVKIYTAADDARGIAQDFGREMDYLTTSQANSGTF